jgi:hypothetical protein
MAPGGLVTLSHRTWFLARRTLEPARLGDTGTQPTAKSSGETAVLARRRVTRWIKAQLSGKQAPPGSRRHHTEGGV